MNHGVSEACASKHRVPGPFGVGSNRAQLRSRKSAGSWGHAFWESHRPFGWGHSQCPIDHLEQKDKIVFDGKPEGYAVDLTHGRFYTNFEDKDRTLANWNASCGEGGPHGLDIDVKAGLLFVACDSLVEVFDTGHDGAIVSKLDTGNGVDSICYSPETHLLYVGAAKAAKVTIAKADDKGQLGIVAQVPTHDGARNGVLDKHGSVYLGHSSTTKLSALVIVSPGGK